MSLPDDVLKHIYNFNLLLNPPNKDLYNHVHCRKQHYVKTIQRWYKKLKICNKMPNLYHIDIHENPDKYPKWFIIRCYMKFYPKKDLKDLPKYMIRAVHGRYPERSVEGCALLEEWKGLKTNFEIFRFMNKFDLHQIMKTGW